SIELLFVDGPEDLSHPRTRLQSELEKMPSKEDRRRSAMLDAKHACALEEPVHGGAVEVAGAAAKTVGLGESREQLQVDFLREPAECAIADFVADLVPHAGFQMLRDHAEHLAADVVPVDGVHVQPVEERRCGRYALVFV